MYKTRQSCLPVNIILLMLVTIFSNCNSSDESKKISELEEKIKHLEAQKAAKELTDKTDLSESNKMPDSAKIMSHFTNRNPEKKNEISQTKYCYVKIITIEPEPVYMPSSDILGVKPGRTEAAPKQYAYTSGIEEIKNFNEDKKYKLIDRYEARIRMEQFPIKNMRLEGQGVECSILSSDCFVFDTYKEASQHRRNNN